MANAIIGFPRWSEEVVYSGGSWSTFNPLSNLNAPPLSLAARSNGTTLAATQFKGVLTKPRRARMISLCGHNLSADAKVRVALYADLAATELLETTGWVDVWSVVYPWDQVEWEDDQFWTGKYSNEEVDGYAATRPLVMTGSYAILSFTVEIDDVNNPDGTIILGMCDVAAVWQLSVNPIPTSQFGFRPRSTVVEADGGAKYFNRRDKPRVFVGSIPFLPRDEAMTKGFEHQRQLDIDKPFIWIMNPEDATHLIRESYLARNADLPLLAYTASVRSNALPIALEEVIS